MIFLPRCIAPITTLAATEAARYAMTAVRLRVAAAVARTQDGVARVEVLFWRAGLPIGIIAQGADGITFDGLLMPLK